MGVATKQGVYGLFKRDWAGSAAFVFFLINGLTYIFSFFFLKHFSKYFYGFLIKNIYDSDVFIDNTFFNYYYIKIHSYVLYFICLVSTSS